MLIGIIIRVIMCQKPYFHSGKCLKKNKLKHKAPFDAWYGTCDVSIIGTMWNRKYYYY